MRLSRQHGSQHIGTGTLRGLGCELSRALLPTASAQGESEIMTAEPCFICEKPITGEDWTYGLSGNPPIHNSHRHSDDELRAMLDNQSPCTGCDEFCDGCGP